LPTSELFPLPKHVMPSFGFSQSRQPNQLTSFTQ
jgi:hypothetical protein